MTDIILVRHGETDWNVSEVFRGRIDIELSETGLKQAELLAQYLGELKIAAVYSSPLKRALKTADMIADHQNLEAGITPGLIDFDFGEWQGLSHEVVKARHRELYAEWINNPQQVTMSRGECLNDVRLRATKVVNSIVDKYDGKVVLVAHRVVNKVLICALLGLDNSHFWNIKQDTCGITTFSYENERFILTKHNDTSFLRLISKSQATDF
jgi:probable phosphoglycerate mutase